MRRRRTRLARAHRLEAFHPAILAAWIERYQELMRHALVRLKDVRFAPGELDGYFCDELRGALFTAGATTEEIDRIAASLVCWITDQIDVDAYEKREFHWELIARHLVCADMTVGLRDGAVVWIEFPNRPHVH